MAAIDKARTAAEGLLEPDEELIAAIAVQTKGRMVGMVLGGAVGAALANRAKRKDGEGGFPLAASMLVGATPSRLLVWEFGGAFVAKVRSFLGEVPYESITEVATAKSAIAPTGMALALSLTNGSTVKLEGSRGQVRAFVETVAPLAAGC